MKKYYKNNKLTLKPKVILYKGKPYINPSDEILTELGYAIEEIKEVEPVKPKITNDIIKTQRQTAYRMKADQYFIAYQAYTELGELDKAREMKKLWVLEREAIDKQYPYIKE